MDKHRVHSKLYSFIPPQTTLKNQMKSILRRFQLTILLWCLSSVSSVIASNDWLVTGKVLSKSYGSFIAFMGYRIVAGSKCHTALGDVKEYDDMLTASSKLWTARHSYADKFRDNFNSRMLVEYGDKESKKMISIMEKYIEGPLLGIVSEHMKAKGDFDFCMNLIMVLDESNLDFVNTNNKEFMDISNSLSKR